MRPSLRQVLFRSAGLDLNFAGGVFSLNNTRTASPAAIPGWSFSRTDTNGIATALDLAGNVIQFATGVPRITNRGILVEEARTNLAPWSENASSGMSFNGGATFTANTGTSPAGTTTADTLTLTSLGYAYAPTAAGQAIGTYTGSLWLRADAPTTVAIRLTRAALGANQTVQTASVTTSWQRFSVSLLTTGIDTIQFGLDQRTIVGGPGTDATVQIWGLQVELGAFATSPIITTGAAGTRAIDDTFMSGLAFLSGAVAYTLIVDTEWNTAGDAATRMFAEGNTSGSAAGATVSNVTGSKARAIQRSGSNRTDTFTNGPVQTNGQITRIAVASSGALCINSVLQSSSFTPTESNWSGDLRVGGRGQSGSPSLPANGYIRRIQVLPYAASDAQLQALTAP
jgi:hypothetical protein